MAALKKLIILSAVTGVIFLANTQLALAVEVVINEVFANPVDENDEFIELYNLSDQAVEITGYKISDLIKTYIINEATISAKGFFVLEKNATGIQLNNSGDEVVTLKDSSDSELNSFSYNGTVEGKSFSRIGDGDDNWIAETVPTKNAANEALPSPSPSQSPSPSPSPTPAPSPSPSPNPSLEPSPQSTEILSTEILLEELGTESGFMLLASPSGKVKGASKSKDLSKRKEGNYLTSSVLIGLGLLLVIGTGVVFYRQDLYNQGND